MKRIVVTLLVAGLGGCISNGPTAPDDPEAFGPREPLHLRDTINIGFRPYGVAMAGNTALVTQLDAGIQLFQLPSKTSTSMSVGNVPTGIAVNASGTRALVTIQHDNDVGIIDVGSATEVRRLDLGATTFRAVFSSDGSRGYVTNSSGSVFAVNVPSGTLIDTAAIVTAANGIALVGDTLLILTSMGGSISYVDVRTFTETKRISGSGVYQDVVVRPTVNRFYVAVESRPVIEIRALDTGEIVDSIMVGRVTFGLTRRPGSGELWAAHPGLFGPGSISIIDLSSREVTRTIPLSDPRRIAFDAQGNQGIVSDQSGSVYFLRP